MGLYISCAGDAVVSAAPPAPGTAPPPLHLDDSQERARLRAKAEREATEVVSGARCAGCRHSAHKGRVCVSCGHANYSGLALLAARQRVASAEAASAATIPAAVAAQAELEAARAELTTALAPPRPLHPELQADPLARLFLSIAGIVVAHKQGHFALDCWRLQDVSRDTRFVAGETQRGTVADLIRGGLASSGVDEMLREVRACKLGAYGRTQLMYAVQHGDIEGVRQLFRLGCPNVNAHVWSLTALQEACDNCYEAVVRELLAQGADPDIRTKRGLTPVMIASLCNDLAVVRLQCDAPGGVDLACCSEWRDLTALGWALETGYDDVAAFLRSRGAPE